MGTQVRTPALPPGFTLDTATLSETEPNIPELPEGFRLATPSIPGTEQTGLPGVPVINPRRVIREVDDTGTVKGALDVTLGAVGRGVGAVVEGLGGALEALPVKHPLSLGRGKGPAKAITEAGRYLSKRPAWIDEISESPERWTDPAFISNLAFEGAGSTLPGLVTGLGAAGVAGRVAARVPVPVFQKAAAFATGTTIGSFFETLTDAGSAYNDAIERHGASPEAAALVFTETVKREFPLTAGMSVTEFLPLAKGGMARALQVGLNAALEGGEEVVQGATQRSVRRDVLGEDVSLLEGAEEEFAGGVLGGGLLHGARAAARRFTQPGMEVVSDEVDIDDDIPLAAIPESIQPERAPVQPRGSREAAQAVAAEKLRQAGAKQSVAQVVDEARAWLADRDGPFDRNDFVDDTGNNPIQTAAAFAKLESEGLIRGRRGDGRTVYERVALAPDEVTASAGEVLPLPGEADPGVSRDAAELRVPVLSEGDGDTASAQEAPAAVSPGRLPRDLAGAKPRYKYGETGYDLDFADDVDKAAYITAQRTRSKRDADYVRFVGDNTGLGEGEIRSLGERVRAQIKVAARGAEGGRLRIEPVLRPYLERQKRGAAAAKLNPGEQAVTAEESESGGSIYLGSGLGALQPWFSQKLSPALHRSAGLVARALNPKRVAEAVDMVRPLETVLAKEGQGAGAPLMAALNRAKHTGEVSAGKRLVRLVDANLQKLTREEAFNLMDALEGRAGPMNARVANAFQVARSLTDEIADEAVNLGVYSRTGAGKRVPFSPMSDYYPHVIHGPDALGGGKLRQDVLDNMVRMGLTDVEDLLDSYRRFVESGARQQRLLDHVAQSKKITHEEAWLILKRFRKHVKRHGNIEFVRELNLPFYDPDPRRSLPRHVVGASIRLAQVAELGQENQFVTRQLKNIEDAGGNSDWAERAVDKIVGWANQADEKDARVLRVARAIQGFKLSLAAIPNSTQGVLNSLLAADAPALAAGLRAALSRRGWRFAIESGASIDPILHESVRDLAGTNRALDVYLRATGFAATERWNRVLAANTGAAYAKRLLPKAMMGHQRSVRVLTDLGIDVAAARQRGSLSADDVLMAAKRFSDITQFRSSPENLPDLATSGWGRVFFQFKNFAYNQTRFLHNQTVGELRKGEYGRGLRNLLILATLFPLTGEAVQDIRELIRGRERKARGLERYFENLGAVGSLGIAFDLVEGGRHGRSLEFFAGPTLSDAARLTNVIGAKDKPKALKRFALQRFGSVGTAIAERVK